MVNSSFFVDGGVYDTDTVTSNDSAGSTAPSQSPSSFYPAGTVYNETDEAASAASASAAAASAAQASASAASAATSAASAGAAAAASVAAAAGTATPLVNGTASVGTSTKWAHEDHRHPTDSTRAPLNAPAFTGNPTAVTPTAGDNTTRLATTAFVQTAVAGVVNSAPATLDTLNELATALGNDPNFATTTAAQIGLKAPSASPALTGTPTAPTASAGTNTTQLATTAFVLANAATSIAGNTGPFTLSTGLANTGNALRAALSSVTNALGADVNLTSSGVYADGPSCAQGTTGVWLAIGTVNVWDTLGSASISCKLWDGTTVVASSLGITAGSNLPLCVTLAGLFTNPTGNIRISCADNNGSPSGRIKASASGNGKDSTLTVVRIA